MPNPTWKEASSIIKVIPGLIVLKIADLVRLFLWMIGEDQRSDELG